MTHKKRREQAQNSGRQSDQVERNDSDSKVRRKKKADVARSDDASRNSSTSK